MNVTLFSRLWENVDLRLLRGGWNVPEVRGDHSEAWWLTSELELQIFMVGLVLCLKPNLVIETGCHAGLMTRALGVALEMNERGRLISCDIDADRVQMATKLSHGLPVEVRHCPASELPIEDADLIFIDSSNASRVEEVKRVRMGAVAVMHDTHTDADLREAVAGITGRIDIVTPRGFTMFRRT